VEQSVEILSIWQHTFVSSRIYFSEKPRKSYCVFGLSG